jgi:hypothetical protein
VPAAPKRGCGTLCDLNSYFHGFSYDRRKDFVCVMKIYNSNHGWGGEAIVRPGEGSGIITEMVEVNSSSSRGILELSSLIIDRRDHLTVNCSEGFWTRIKVASASVKPQDGKKLMIIF